MQIELEIQEISKILPIKIYCDAKVEKINIIIMKLIQKNQLIIKINLYQILKIVIEKIILLT